ncbi:uncharacterized protein LOC131215333 [Anopheles bellator]|uniref:uncharacterized protein LOC131215333 n=1 Tax=Anopheles bellator TaxID=139047 RepID=UPI002647FF02|nr:uncharacterized protein LOC131215333 [Anopheles bellator]
MKVDKAVCTNGTLGDLGRAIQFEAVFSTLVENKMLAIKRECEFKKRHKKSRLLRKAVFNRKVTTACCHQSVTTSASGSISAGDPDGTSEPDYADRNGALAEHASGSAAGWRIYESEDRRANGAASLAIDNSLISDDADEVIVEIGDLSSLVDSDGNVVVTTNAVDSARRFQADIPRDECYSPSLVRDNPVSTAVNLTPTSSDSGQPSNADVRTRESTVIKAGVPPQRSDQKTTTRKPSVFEPISIEIEHESFDLNDSATNVAMELDGVRGGVSGKRGSTASEPISIIKNSVQQHATAASAAGYRFGTGSYLSPGSAVNRLRLLEAKSISAQNSPILRRQRTGTEGRHLTFSPATYRQHSSTKTSAIECDSSLMDLSKAEANHLQHLQQHQQHYNSTVIVKEQKLVPVAGDGRRTARGGTTKATQLLGTNGGSSSSASMKNKLAQKNCNNHSAIADDDNTAIGEPMAESPSTLGFIESFNQLTASNLAVIATHTARQSPPVSDTVKLQHCRRPPRGTTTYCSVGELNKPHVQDPSPSASHKLPPPAYSSMVDETVSTSMVKTAELAKSITNLARASGSQRHRKESDFLRQSSCNVELHHGPTTSGTCSRRSNAKEHHHRKGNGAGSYGYGDSSYIMGYDVNESDEDKLNKRKYKYLKRCSDPVIVFPTTSGSGGSGGGSGRGGDGASGLQHCILSRPPNQLIQFPYDEDLMYDISMQMESDCHGELDSIVSEKKKKHKHSRHHHHHHRHCKKTRHKKRKILVHDLDDQSVKVIDPDDLPQRARWTIIATACLLLIMCLLLVGITLRMAPIIDDMVRQENERLMRESLDRAKMIKNYTEYNRMIGGDETP